MATDKTDATTPQGDGADRTPGIPDPNPLVPKNPAVDASTEPAAAAVAEAAGTPGTSETPETVAPPLPADYEMPDDYATEDPVAKVKAWVEANPGLAVIGAAGIGLLAGRIVTALIPDPEPESLSDRVEARARKLSKQAKKAGKTYRAEAAAFTETAGDSLQDSLHRAADALKEAASNAGDTASEGYEKTKDLAETIADAAKVAVTGVLATKVDDWIKKARD